MLGGQSDIKLQNQSRERTAARDEVLLIDRIVKGDLAAFDALYRIYHPKLKHFLVRMTRQPGLADEVLNDTMMVVWKRADRYNGKSKVSTWIFAIAYRQALKGLRRFDAPVEDAFAEQRRSLDADPEQQLGQVQVQQNLQAALGDLSADHRAVVDLTYYHEIGYREIAEIMDCPVDTVKTRMFHARRHLKNRLAGGLTDWL